MAIMNIDIAGMPVKLINRPFNKSNSCYSTFVFIIESVPGNSITVDVTGENESPEDYDYAMINPKLKQSVQFRDTHTFTMDESGQAAFSLVIGNVRDVALKAEALRQTSRPCNATYVRVTDNTLGEVEDVIYKRCSDEPRCENKYDPKPELTIDNDTNVRIYFDSSGSMKDTLAPLQTMRDTLLKDALLPYYNNDETLYNSKVQVLSQGDERTLDMLNINGDSPTGNIISLVFQDEAHALYTGNNGWTIHDPIIEPGTGPSYGSDMQALRTRLDAYAENTYRGVIFQVATVDSKSGAIYENFKALLKAIEYGSGSYSGTNGLSDRNEFNYKYDVTPSSTPEYYKDLIITALEELGFTI